MEPLIMQFFPVSYHFPPLDSNTRIILGNSFSVILSLMFFPYYERPSFT
jgi:hypothetical protein